MDNKLIYESENVIAKESFWEHEEIILHSPNNSMNSINLSYNEMEKLYHLIQLRKLETISK